MKYTLPVIAKAAAAVITGTLGAAVVAAGGVDVATLDVGQWMAALAAGLVSGGAVFGTPNKDTESPADKVVAGVQAVKEAKAKADLDLDKIRDLAVDIGEELILGPLSKQIFK